MSEKNGWVLKALVSAFWGLIVIILTSTVNATIQNDKDSRLRDDCIKNDMQKIVVEQLKVNAETNGTLREILTELKYMKNGQK